MTPLTDHRQLDVLLIESHPHVADRAQEVLAAAGHRIHRCHTAHDPSFPCRGLQGHVCPIDEGVDVAVVARRGVTPQPTAREVGVVCALRAGVPVIEDGPAILDPYEPWMRERNPHDLGRACAEAANGRYEPLRQAAVELVAPILGAAGVDPVTVTCEVRREGHRLLIELRGPAVSERVAHALSVRVLDAVRGDQGTYDRIDVGYDPVDR